MRKLGAHANSLLPTVIVAGAFFAAAGVFISACGSAQAAWNQSLTMAANAKLSKIVTGAVPSVSACITIDGNTVYKNAFGTIAPGVSATPQTIYRIGSLSKQFVAAAILALIEDGTVVPEDGSAFGLQSNIALFFPAAGQWSSPDGPPMTVKRLLTMTSNLPSYTNSPPPGLLPAQAVAAPALLSGILAFKPNGLKPAYAYSNTNYFLLASIIDVLINPNARARFHKPQTGPALVFLNTDYRAYLRKRIFARAGLTATNFIDDPKPLGTMAPPAAGAGTSFANPSWPKGAGALQSNALDLCAWDSALMKDQVISANSVAIMGTPGMPGSNYAMGWFVNSVPGALEYAHNGDIPGYTAENVIDLYGGSHFVSVSILTNGDYTPGLLQAAQGLAASARKAHLAPLFPMQKQ